MVHVALVGRHLLSFQAFIEAMKAKQLWSLPDLPVIVERGKKKEGG